MFRLDFDLNVECLSMSMRMEYVALVVYNDQRRRELAHGMRAQYVIPNLTISTRPSCFSLIFILVLIHNLSPSPLRRRRYECVLLVGVVCAALVALGDFSEVPWTLFAGRKSLVLCEG